MAILEVHQLKLSIAEKIFCDNLTFTIEPGQMWALLGRNGSGKTTLLHALARLHEINGGMILLKSQPIHTLSRRNIARELAILFQDYERPFPSSVFETAAIGRHPHLRPWQWESEEDKKIVVDALTTMDLLSFKDRDQCSLSGGEKRRLAIATVLSQTPALFLLDEPINHLDLNYQIKVLKHFQGLCREQNKAVLLSIHDINLAARFCDYMIMLFDHSEVAVGPKNILLQKNKLEKLYQQPVFSVATKQGDVWLPNLG